METNEMPAFEEGDEIIEEGNGYKKVRRRMFRSPIGKKAVHRFEAKYKITSAEGRVKEQLEHGSLTDLGPAAEADLAKRKRP